MVKPSCIAPPSRKTRGLTDRISGLPAFSGPPRNCGQPARTSLDLRARSKQNNARRNLRPQSTGGHRRAGPQSQVRHRTLCSGASASPSAIARSSPRIKAPVERCDDNLKAGLPVDLSCDRRAKDVGLRLLWHPETRSPLARQRIPFHRRQPTITSGLLPFCSMSATAGDVTIGCEGSRGHPEITFPDRSQAHTCA